MTVFILFLFNLLSLLPSDKIIFINTEDSVLVLEDSIIDRYNIGKIQFVVYITDDEKRNFHLDKNVNSILYTVRFDTLSRMSSFGWVYSGIDSAGQNHFVDDSSDFQMYSFLFEERFIYGNDSKLLFVEYSGRRELAGKQYIYNSDGTVEIQYFSDDQNVQGPVAKEFLREDSTLIGYEGEYFQSFQSVLCNNKLLTNRLEEWYCISRDDLHLTNNQGGDLKRELIAGNLDYILVKIPGNTVRIIELLSVN